MPTQSTERSPAEAFTELRPLLFGIAYRMLASVGSAEDVLQEAFIRFDRAWQAAAAGERPPIESPRAFLSAVVTRLAIDELTSARSRRESYSGIWLPEPLMTHPDASSGQASSDPHAHAALAESLSMAFLLVLERLNPIERAVFLLHDVFGYEFAELPPMVGRSVVNCRQIAARARRRVREHRPPLQTDRGQRDETARRFVEAMLQGDMEALVRLLADDVSVYGDGGGKAPQWSVPITGVDRVARLLVGVGRQIAQYGLTLEAREINGQPGVIVRTPAGEVTNVFAIEVIDGLIRVVRGVTNPDKLRHLGPVADIRAVARGGS